MNKPLVVVLGPKGVGKSVLLQKLQIGTTACHFVESHVTLDQVDPHAAAIILLVDGAANSDHQETAKALRRFQEQREQAYDVGGVPVFVVATRCDQLHLPDDTADEWLTRTNERTQALSSELVALESEQVAYGTVRPRAAATAARVPETRSAQLYCDSSGAFGIDFLRSDVVQAALVYTRRRERSRRRLHRMVTALGTVVMTMIASHLLFFQATPNVPKRSLEAEVLNYQKCEPQPELRLASSRLPAVEHRLKGMAQHPDFQSLPDSLRDFVTSRLTECEKYREYRARFDPPRLGPAEIVSREEAQILDQELDGILQPPAEWRRTEAAELWEKWRHDRDLLEKEETAILEKLWSLVRRGTSLLDPDDPANPEWRTAIDSWLKEAQNPLPEGNSPIPDSRELTIPRGTQATYVAIRNRVRVVQALAECQTTRETVFGVDRLCAGLGLTPTGEALLVFPTAGGSVDSARLGAERQRRLKEFPPFSLSTLPERFRGQLEARLQTSRAAAIRHLQRLVARKFRSDEMVPRRKEVAQFLIEDSAIQAWGDILMSLKRYTVLAAPQPAEEAAQFLTMETQEFRLAPIEITLPDDLFGKRLTPGDDPEARWKWVVIHESPGGIRREEIWVSQSVTREHASIRVRFQPSSPRHGSINYRPGDSLFAELRLGGKGMLLWSDDSPFRVARLSAEPILLQDGRREPATGVRLTAPEGTFPVIPELLATTRFFTGD